MSPKTCLRRGDGKIPPRTAPHCTVIECIKTHCTPLKCTAKQRTIKQRTPLYYNSLHCTTLNNTTLHNTTLHCTTLHHPSLFYTALHCSACTCWQLVSPHSAITGRPRHHSITQPQETSHNFTQLLGLPARGGAWRDVLPPRRPAADWPVQGDFDGALVV